MFKRVLKKDLTGLFREIKHQMEKNPEGSMQRFNDDWVQHRTVPR